MAVKATFGKNSYNPNNNDCSSDDNNTTTTTTNNENINMHKEESSPCWSSYWKFLQPQDEMWIVTDNARSHETRRLLTVNGFGSASPEIHWDRTKDSVVGFCNAKTNRWGVSSALSPTPPQGESTSTTNTTHSAATTTSITSTPKSSGNSTRIKACSLESAVRQSLETSLSLEDTDSVRQDSLLMQPSRRESLVLLGPMDLGLIMPERRTSEDSVLTFRNSIGSISLGTFESILEDVCGSSDLGDDDDNDDEDDDDDDDDDDDYTQLDDNSIPTASSATDNNNDGSTNEDEFLESISRRFQSNNKSHDNYSKPPHPDLPWPPKRRVLGTAADASTSPTTISKLDGARRFAPMIRGTSLPNLDSSRTKGPSVPVRRSSACSMPADVRSTLSLPGGSSGMSGTVRRPSSNFEAILEYEPLQDLPSVSRQDLPIVSETLSRQSTTSEGDEDNMDQRWIEAGSGTRASGNAFTLVPMDSLRLSRHMASPRRTTNEHDTTTTKNHQETTSDDDDDDGNDTMVVKNERLCVDEYDGCGQRRLSYSPRRSTRNSMHSLRRCQDPSDTSGTLPSTLLTSIDIAKLSLDDDDDDDNNNDDDASSRLSPPPLIEMDDSPCAMLHNGYTNSLNGDEDGQEEGDEARRRLFTTAGSTPRMPHPSRKSLTKTK